MALFTLVDKITEALDKGDYVIGVFLDFSKAFDTVDHSILLARMFTYGIREVALQWFKDYLTGRVQFVTYNGFKSSNGEIKCGVSSRIHTWTPAISNIYQWFSNSVKSMFIDSICRWFKCVNIWKRCRGYVWKVKQWHGNIRQWLCCYKLSLNVSKTHYMVFTPRNKQVENLI